jgi:hypothetical protein
VRSNAPPPERNTTPFGKPLTVPLRLNPTRCCPANAVDPGDADTVLCSLPGDAGTDAGDDGLERGEV